MGGLPTGRPDEDDRPATQFADRHEPTLPVVEPVVLTREHRPLEDQGGIVEVEPALRQCPGTLGGIARDGH